MNDGRMIGAPRVLLLSALIYPIACVAIFVLTFRADAFAIFDPGYLVLSFVALPVVWGFFSILWAGKIGPLPKLWVALHVGVLGVVTFMHFWMVAQFAAGV